MELRTLARTAALASMAAITLALPQAARGAEPGDIGLFFDAAGTQTSLEGIDAFEPFEAYVVAFDPPGGVSAFEFQIEWPLQLIAAGFQCLPIQSCACNECVETWVAANFWDGHCVPDTGAHPIARWTRLISLVPLQDAQLCLRPADSHYFGGTVQSPAYAECAPPYVVRAFGRAYPGCAVVNPVNVEPPVPGGVASWGTVKSRFGG